ncbi:MAG: type III-B CRISPR-associated protein Cas10/Cmr2 [Bacteroidales bacterium]|nr:type III-B CRISPR-associated protein Cas10/Cmr2 [Bacteroidales bacterium]
MKYTAITIGPIYKTFMYAKKTRELWTASYLFSYLMKKLILALKDADKNIDIIIPFTDEDLLTSKNETGLFPDRLVFQTNIKFEDIKNIIDKELERIAFQITLHLNIDDTDYFKNYFQVYAVEKEFEKGTLKRDIVKNLFDTLDVLELQQKFEHQEPTTNIQSFLTKASLKNGEEHSFLMQDAREDKDIEKFQSIIEISAYEIIESLNEEDKVKFYEKLKQSFSNNKSNDNDLIKFLKNKNKDTFRTHHKYLAILQIDGDSFGIINQFLDDTDYQKFSESLANYSLEIKDIIKDYGGLPVYIGGDDVLAFVPVRNKEQNIFTILEDIDKVFNEEFKYFIDKKVTDDNGNIIKDKDGNIIKPALSAGISITYYKYPLNEALALSYDLLFKKAKNHNGKDAVAFEVIKHSGQTFCTIFGKGTPIYEKFNKLIALNIDEDEFFSSVIQKFFENFELLEIIGNNKDRIKAYRDEFFNESFHGTKDKFLTELEEYISLLFTTNVPNTTNKIKDKLYASLRMVKFLNRDDNE